MRAAIAGMMIGLMIGVTACGGGGTAAGNGGSARPATPAKPHEPTPVTATLGDDELAAVMGELTGFVGQLATAVESAGRDCTAMAAGIERVAADHAGLLERVRTLDDPSVEDRAEAWKTAHGAQLEPLVARLTAGTAACTDDAAVRAALARIGT